jgi:hypothetical protein
MTKLMFRRLKPWILADFISIPGEPTGMEGMVARYGT